MCVSVCTCMYTEIERGNLFRMENHLGYVGWNKIAEMVSRGTFFCSDMVPQRTSQRGEPNQILHCIRQRLKAATACKHWSPVTFIRNLVGPNGNSEKRITSSSKPLQSPVRDYSAILTLRYQPGQRKKEIIIIITVFISHLSLVTGLAISALQL